MYIRDTRTYRPLIPSLVPLFLCACSAPALTDGTNALPAASSAPLAAVQRTVRTGEETPVSIATTPEASCVLRPAGISDGQHMLRLDADDQGVVRFHSLATDSSSANMALDCAQKDGGSASYSVLLRADAVSPVSAPAPRFQPSGRLRPALSGDPAALSNRDLVARGYPRRPDASKAPAAYAKWLESVSRDVTLVSPRMVARPDFRPRSARPALIPSTQTFNAQFANWAGAYVTNPVGQFYQIQAEWLVPLVNTIPASLIYADTATWIGLDNGASDLVQSGTDSNSFNFDDNWTFTTYNTWLESLPDNSYFLPNFSTNAFDHISVDIFLADENGQTWFTNGTTNGQLTDADDSVWFMIDNMTQNEVFWGTLPRRSEFTGSTADFIVEKAAGNLAPFFYSEEFNCWLSDSEIGQYSLDFNGGGPLDSTLNVVDMVSPAGTLLANTYVLASDPPGGGNVVVFWDNYN